VETNFFSSSALVIDAGIGFRLVVPHAEQPKLRNQVAQAYREGVRIYAPTLWRYELTTIFTKAVHFQQMTIEEARSGLQLALELTIELVQPDSSLTLLAFGWTERLGRAAAYDSFYLALAERLGCELWTVDRRLVNATNLAWVRDVG
jgi:predicted nucleic acid-binding protein